MVRSRSLLFSSLALATALGCSFSHDASKGGNGPITPSPDAAFNGDRTFVEGGGAAGDINGDACGSNNATANHLPPDLLIVLDRSGSMTAAADGSNCNNMPAGCSKWDQMTAAINQVVGTTQGAINWGLLMFGSGGNGSCNVPNMANVPPATMNGGRIATAIVGGSPPASSTPTRTAVNNAAAYLRTLTDPNPKVILLATDGQPNCAMGGNAGAVDDPAAIAAVGTAYNGGMGFPVYVIGIGSTGAEATLNSMAMAGGRPQAGTPQYFPVASTADLAAALTMIQGMTNLPCKFTLNGMVTDASMVSVTIGGVKAPTGTFTLDPGGRGITFSGTTCDMLTAGSITNVAINIGCQILIP